MSDVLLLLAAVGGGIGGLVGAVYTGVRLTEWLRERSGRVSLKEFSYGVAPHVNPDYRMVTFGLRLYNPKATAVSISKVVLEYGPSAPPVRDASGHVVLELGAQGVILSPLKRRNVRLEKSGDFPIELPPKRHTELELGYSVERAASHEGKKFEGQQLVISLADGSKIRSARFDWESPE